MGRTVPTFTQVIQKEIQTWSKFRRGLRKEDQETFDEMFRAPRIHLAASTYTMRVIPFESVAMAIMLEQQKEIRELRQGIAGLEARMKRLEENAPAETPEQGFFRI
jgi:hypothetical protein